MYSVHVYYYVSTVYMYMYMYVYCTFRIRSSSSLDFFNLGNISSIVVVTTRTWLSYNVMKGEGEMERRRGRQDRRGGRKEV